MSSIFFFSRSTPNKEISRVSFTHSVRYSRRTEVCDNSSAVRGFTWLDILHNCSEFYFYPAEDFTQMYHCTTNTQKRRTAKYTHTLGYLGPRATCRPAWHSDTWDPFKAAVDPPTSTTSFPLQTHAQRLTPARRHRHKGLGPVTLFSMWPNQSVTHCRKRCHKRMGAEALMCHTVIVLGANVQLSSTIVRPRSSAAFRLKSSGRDTDVFYWLDYGIVKIE